MWSTAHVQIRRVGEARTGPRSREISHKWTPGLLVFYWRVRGGAIACCITAGWAVLAGVQGVREVGGVVTQCPVRCDLMMEFS